MCAGSRVPVYCRACRFPPHFVRVSAMYLSCVPRSVCCFSCVASPACLSRCATIRALCCVTPLPASLCVTPRVRAHLVWCSTSRVPCSCHMCMCVRASHASLACHLARISRMLDRCRACVCHTRLIHPVHDYCVTYVCLLSHAFMRASHTHACATSRFTCLVYDHCHFRVVYRSTVTPRRRTERCTRA